MVDEGGREISAVCLPRAGTPQAIYGLGSGIFPDVVYNFRKDQYLVVWTDIPAGLAGQRISDEWPIFQAGGLLLFHMDGDEAQKSCLGRTQVAGIYYTDQRQVLLDRAFMRVYKHRRAAGCEQFIPLDLDATIGDYLWCMRRSHHVGQVRFDPYQMHDFSTWLWSDGLPMTEFARTVLDLTSMGWNLLGLIKNGKLLLTPDA